MAARTSSSGDRDEGTELQNIAPRETSRVGTPTANDEPSRANDTTETASTMDAKDAQNRSDDRDAAAAALEGGANDESRGSKASEDKFPSSGSSEEGNQRDEEKGLAEKPAEAGGGGEGEEKKQEEELSPGRSKGKIALIMLALCMAVFLAALDVTIITTALPTISEHFQSSAGYTWIGSAFLLANAASIPSWGKVSDIFGRKPMLLVANIIFMVGSLVAALANSIGMLIAARAVQGIGGGGLIILVNILIGDLFSMRSRAAFYGLIGGVWAIASSIGPIIGGAFTQAVSWRW